MSAMESAAAQAMAALLGAPDQATQEELLAELPAFATREQRRQAEYAVRVAYGMAWANAVTACLKVLADHEGRTP